VTPGGPAPAAGASPLQDGCIAFRSTGHDLRGVGEYERWLG
jgi:hypothetical protein